MKKSAYATIGQFTAWGTGAITALTAETNVQFGLGIAIVLIGGSGMGALSDYLYRREEKRRTLAGIDYYEII